MSKACKECRYPNPVVFDRKIGQDVTPWCTEKDFSDVEAIEAMDQGCQSCILERAVYQMHSLLCLPKYLSSL